MNAYKAIAVPGCRNVPQTSQDAGLWHSDVTALTYEFHTLTWNAVADFVPRSLAWYGRMNFIQRKRMILIHKCQSFSQNTISIIYLCIKHGPGKIPLAKSLPRFRRGRFALSNPFRGVMFVETRLDKHLAP